MLRKFTHTIHVPGTLAADLDVRWAAASDCTLLHVSAVGSNAAAYGLSIGTSADDDACLTKNAAGVSGAPVSLGRASFVGGEFPRIEAGAVIVVGVDYDYNGGGTASPSANVTVMLTLAEG